MAAELSYYDEFPQPDNTIFGDIRLGERNYTTFNDVMIEIRKCIHADLPRYTLLPIKEIDSEFSCHTKYYQGILTYCVACVCLFVLCLFVIAIYLYITVNNDADDVSPDIMKRYRISLITSAMFILIFTVIAFVGVLGVQIGWRQINREHTSSGLRSLEEFHKTMTSVNHTVFQELQKFRVTVSQLNLYGYMKDMIKQAVKTNVLYLLDKADEAKEPMEMLLYSVHFAISTLTDILTAEIVSICVGVVILLWTMAISVMMVKGAFKLCDTDLNILWRLACCTLVVWWVVAVLTLPAALTLADFCYDPQVAGAEFTHCVVPQLQKQLVYYYLSCDGENPLAFYMNILATIFTTMLTPLIEVFSNLKSFGIYDNGVVEQLRFGRDFLNEALRRGCERSKYLYDNASYLGCNYMLLGILMVAFAAIYIAIILTFYVILCLKVRDLIEHIIQGDFSSLLGIIQGDSGPMTYVKRNRIKKDTKRFVSQDVSVQRPWQQICVYTKAFPFDRQGEPLATACDQQQLKEVIWQAKMSLITMP